MVEVWEDNTGDLDAAAGKTLVEGGEYVDVGAEDVAVLLRFGDGGADEETVET